MNVPETPSVVKDIVDNADERELWIVGREFERPPYYHAGKGGDTRLPRALRVCVEGRITPNSDGSYTVEGSEKRTYRCAESCSCPHSQQSKSKWCYHMVAVALYVEWQRRLRGSAPVALGTLRAGTLPVQPPLVGALRSHAVALGTMHDSTALSTHHTPQEDRMPDDAGQVRITVDGIDYPTHTPQEDRMPDDDAQYIPEPHVPPVAVLDAPAATPALRPLAPADDDLEQALATWTVQRGIVRKFLAQELKANVDYYTLKIGGKDSKPSLSKAGAEKVLGWLRWSASFAPDVGTWEMLGRPTDVVFYVCTLRTRSGEIVGEGRGARSLKKDGGDVNKAIKMAEKSAMVSSVLRTGAISDCFTQDLEDVQDEPAKAAPGRDATPAKPTSQDLRQRLWGRMKELYPAVHSREDAEAWIKARTGLELHPDNYQAILSKLET